MATIRVDGLDAITNKMANIAKWSERDATALKAINKRVGEVYNNALRANIKDAKSDIKVYNRTGGGPGRKAGKTGTVRQVIKRGTLRRSIKVWQPRRASIFTLAGPRTRNKRDIRTNRVDGWYSAIVENGAGFGGKKASRNAGLFIRTQMATQSRMNKLQQTLLRQQFARYFKTA